LVNSSPFDREHPSSGLLQWEEIGSIDSNPAKLEFLSPVIEPSTHPQEQVAGGEMVKSSLAQQWIREGSIHPIANKLELLEPPIAIPAVENSIERDLAELAQLEPLTRSESLLQELRTTHDRLLSAQAELQLLQERDRSQIDGLEQQVLEVKQIKFRIQQIARHSKKQLARVQEMLAALEQVRQEIVTGLERFGGYEQIQSMLAQLEETRYALIIAHDRLKTGQEAFYESLAAIKEESAARSHESEQKLDEYHQSLTSIMQSLEDDRIQIAGMAVSMALQVTEISELKIKIEAMHGQMEEKSHTLHGKIQEITAGFAELSDSVQTEKEQFYQLTAETIDKAEVMRSQFAEIAKQITHDRSVIENLKTDIESVRKVLDGESIQELNLFGQRSKEMMSTWMDIQNRQKMLALRYSRISVWLWILTFGMGVILVLLIAILIRLN
jgi:uncharacterized phage infection (PIP) family protein YhgE